MLIGIDASRAAVQPRTGTEAYAYHLITALITLTADTPHELALYFNGEPAPELFPIYPHVRHFALPLPYLWTHLRLAVHLQLHPPDVFLTPAHVIPLSYFGPSVATIHDLGYDYFPAAHTRRQHAYLRWSTRHNGRRSRRIAADSTATKQDLMQRYGIEGEKITVIYPGFDAGCLAPADPARMASVLQKYRLETPYLLYVGTLQPRKNLARLVQAYAASGVRQQLVLAGRPGWLADSIIEEIARQPKDIRARIILPGYVDEEDKAALITGATALLFPSLYEGFGFPVLEAQACGVPVVCADNSSLPEVAGEAALFVRAEDVAGISEAIRRIIADQPLRARLVEAGRQNVGRFSWQKAGSEMLSLLEAAARDGK
jgi:glycosyltransferase involved in cell wall biosynthesis